MLVCIPTGGGKSATGSAIARNYAGHTLWLAHRTELIKQATGTLQRMGVKDFTVASLQSLLASGRRPDADLVVLDECHHANASTYATVLQHYSSVAHLGLTATPQREDGRALGDHYDRMVCPTSYSELIDEGSLVDCRVIASPQALSGKEVAVDPVDAYLKHTPGQSAFLFAPDVRTSKRHAEAFLNAGVVAAHVDGTTSDEERSEALRAFSAGEVQVLCNVNIFTEGTDVPRCSTVILARGCGSVGLYLQMVGRALRPYPGKECATILDLTGAVLEHGLPTADREWCLVGSGNGRACKAALAMCEQCGACWEGSRTCPVCGYTRPLPMNDEGVRVDIKNIELELAYDGSKTARHMRHKVCRELWDWSKRDGTRIEKAQHRYRELFGGSMPLNEVLSNEEKQSVYDELKVLGRSLNFKSGWCDHKYRNLFGVWPNARKGSRH